MSTIAHFFDANKILWVKLKNSKNANCFSEFEAEQLQALLDEYQTKAMGLVFSSEGSRFFCAGGNLKQYAGMSKSEGLKANKVIRKCMSTLSRWPLPTVCFVVGDCYGGGMEIISAFDYVVSTPASFFGLWQRKNALTFGWGGGARFAQRLSEKKLLSLYLSAKTMSSYEAQKLDVVDKIVSEDIIKEVCGEWVLRQVSLPQVPVGLVKVASLPEDEKDIFENLWGNDEHLNILKKFT